VLKKWRVKTMLSAERENKNSHFFNTFYHRMESIIQCNAYNMRVGVCVHTIRHAGLLKYYLCAHFCIILLRRILVTRRVVGTSEKHEWSKKKK
jgi:hypothetical protein